MPLNALNVNKKFKIDSLKLYLEKIEDIKQTSYFKFVNKNKVSTLINYNSISGLKIIKNHPDEESLKSLILTIRMFIQNNERISINNIEQTLSDLSFDLKIIEKFKIIRLKLNEILNSTAVTYNNKKFTNDEILKIFIYGNYAHLNDEKFKIIQEWKKSQYIIEFKKGDLFGILNSLIRFLLYTENLLKESVYKLSV